jgi:hypothetical protein
VLRLLRQQAFRAIRGHFLRLLLVNGVGQCNQGRIEAVDCTERILMPYVGRRTSN